MGEFDYYDGKILHVAGDAIRAEGDKWKDMSGDMAKVAETTKTLWLTPGAFMVADPWAGPAVSVDQFKIYDDVHQLLCSLFDGATAEFAQLDKALHKLAKEYEESDERTYINISDIYKA
ncbi:hypothetical protein [Actinoplanes friuliensis]|jgi:hypothetical protein|uniref:Uncharacterized protein n=1 Tax=Actinoplanes friuliensis DSM 7358 TaxID=1246995 RepID=U5W4P8_9ACTN|nr:hypothetical protein [Actinoplanes friuliensis]AGZ42911.1 hypothetical protein AFR_23205 [Actinoplanes friuliensis DSM 7358]